MKKLIIALMLATPGLSAQTLEEAMTAAKGTFARMRAEAEQAEAARQKAAEQDQRPCAGTSWGAALPGLLKDESDMVFAMMADEGVDYVGGAGASRAAWELYMDGEARCVLLERYGARLERAVLEPMHRVMDDLTTSEKLAALKSEPRRYKKEMGQAEMLRVYLRRLAAHKPARHAAGEATARAWADEITQAMKEARKPAAPAKPVWKEGAYPVMGPASLEDINRAKGIPPSEIRPVDPDEKGWGQFHFSW